MSAHPRSDTGHCLPEPQGEADRCYRLRTPTNNHMATPPPGRRWFQSDEGTHHRLVDRVPIDTPEQGQAGSPRAHTQTDAPGQAASGLECHQGCPESFGLAHDGYA